MIQLIVQREVFTANSTTGTMSINGTQFCYTLEPRSDQSEGKPYCIPAGTYPVTLAMSPRFGFVTPHVQNVEGFTEIEIHPGNYPGDTEGCCLVGNEQGVDFVGVSRSCFESLMQKISKEVDGQIVPVDPEGITIAYQGGPMLLNLDNA